MGSMTFRKGDSAASFTRTPDSLATNDTVEVLVGISEGPIKGPVNGPKSFQADDTPLVSENGQPNFSNFSLDFFPGSEAGETVTMALGGFGSPINVNQKLASTTAVTRSGVQHNIDAVDFRIVIAQLSKTDDKGIYKDTLSLLFEYKKTSDATWSPCFTGAGGGGWETPPAYGSTGNRANWSYLGDQTPGDFSFVGDRFVADTSGFPSSPPANPNSSNLAVNVAGGTVYHWDTGSTTWSPISVTDHGGYGSFVEQVGTQNVTRHVFYPSDGSTPTAGVTGDVWRRGPNDFLIWNGAAWVTPAVYYTASSPSEVLTNGVWTRTDKVSSNTPINIRMFVPRVNEAYQYRVTKQSTDDTVTQSSTVLWESVYEIKQEPFTFTGLSMVKVLGQASDQFTSLPTWNGIYEGRIVKVPSNYDPVARTYAGVWDGTYKQAYTNNTAFIFQDFVENDRYGLSRIYPHVVNKWSIYNWGQYNDTPVLKADGTYQPRWTFNSYLQQSTDAKEMAQFIAGSAGATVIDDGNGVVDVIVDVDGPNVALFTPQNVGTDGFVYSYTDRLTRPNEITVSFLNPDLNWNEDKRIVTDDTDITNFGRIPENFVAVGAIDVDEALRRARRRLIGGLTEKETVTFTTNRKGRFLSEWDIILVADPLMGRGLPGRVKDITDARSFTLRDSITLETGFTYVATFDIATSTGLQTVRRTVTTAPGTTTSLSFDADLPDLAPLAAFALEAEGVAGFPKPYRVINIENDDGTGDNIKLTALEFNRNKFSFIDSSVDHGVISYSTFDSSIVLPVSSPNVTSALKQVGAISTRVLTLSWAPSVSQWARTTKIYYSINGSVANVIDAKGANSIDIEGAAAGTHTFTLVAVDIKGNESPPISISYDATGVTRSVTAPSNLRLVGALNATTFNTLDAEFAWDAAAANPNFDHYEAQVISGTTLLRSTNLGASLSYTYKYDAIKADGLHRLFAVALIAHDQDGNTSAPIVITVSNAAPATPTNVTAQFDVDSILVNWDGCAEADYAGTMVWLSTIQGFTPSSANAVFSGPGTQARIPFTTNVDTYVRVGHYDHFSATPVNLSDEKHVAAEQSFASKIAAVQAVSSDVTDGLHTQINGVNTDLQATKTSLTAESASLSNTITNLASEVNNRIADVGSVRATADAATASLASEISNRTADVGSVRTTANAAVANLNAEIASRASADTVIQSSVTGLTSTVNGHTASISSESTTRANSDSALGVRIDNLITTVGSNSASVTSEIAARTNADSALGVRIDTVTSTVSGHTATISSNYTTLATADSALGSRIDSLTTTVNANSASLGTEISARTTADTALGSRIDTVTTTANGNVAAISSETTARSSADSALGVRIDTLNTTVGSNSASITSEIAARTTADSALGVRIDSLTTTVNGNVASISSEATARSTADGALGVRIDTLTTTVGTNAATVTSETLARTNADTALGSRIDTVTTTVSGHTASISAEVTARSNADSAITSSVTRLSSISPVNALNANPLFINYTNANGIPDSWGDWQSGSNGYRVTGEAGSYAYDASSSASANQGIAQALPLTNGWYVIEASVNIESGNCQGAGVYYDGCTPQIKLDFSLDADTNGFIGVGSTGVRRFSKLFQTTGSTGSGNLYLMTNWDGFTRGSKQMRWYRCLLRPASDGEIKAGVALTSASSAIAQVASEATTRTAADSALGIRIDTVSSTVSGHTATISSNYTTLANADTALGGRIDSLTTTVGGNAASVTAEALARSNADSALSSSITRISSISQANGLNANPIFSNYTATSGIPDSWGDWSSGGIGTRQTGEAGSYGFDVTVSSTLAQGIAQTINLSAGSYVMEASVNIESGSSTGSGLFLYIASAAFNLSFSTDPDTNGTIGTGIGVRRYSKLVTIPAGSYLFYAMTNWDGLGALTAKQLRWYKALIRPATDGEIKAGTAVANAATALAQISSESTTRTAADSALGGRIDVLSTSVGNNASSITSEITSRSNADSALGGRIDAVVVTSGGNSTSITNEISARTNADSALGGRIDALTVTVGGNTASINSEAVARANADSSAASLISNLTSVYSPSLSSNPNFLSYNGTGSLPLNWLDAGSGYSAFKGSGLTPGSASYVLASQGQATAGLYQSFYVPKGWYVFEADAWCSSGDFQGAGLYLADASHAGGTLSCAADPDTDGVTGTGGNPRSWRKLVYIPYAYQSGSFYLLSGWSGFGTVTAKTVYWFHAAFRAASSAEILAKTANDSVNTALAQISSLNTTVTNANAAQALKNDQLTASINGVSGTVSTQAGVLATLQGKVTAYLTSTVDSGTNTATFTMVADNATGSLIRLKADKISLGNTDALVVSGGQVRIQNAYISGAYIDNLSVGNAQIANNSVVVSAFATNTTYGYVFSSSQGNVGLAGVNITTTGGSVEIVPTVSALTQNSSYSTGDLHLLLYRDGALIADVRVEIGAQNDQPVSYQGGGGQAAVPATVTIPYSSSGIFSFSYLDTPGAGQHSYSFYISTSIGLVTHNYSSILVKGLQK
jgi:predicted phage tail protein